MSGIQDWIYHWGEGAGARSLKFLLLLLSVAVLAVIYDLRAYQCFAQAEAMEVGQLARHLAAGDGYTTQVIRPFALFLLQQRANQKVDRLMHSLPADQLTVQQKAQIEVIKRPGQLQLPHPDITNPPLYPCILATFMQLAPFHYDIKGSERFIRYQPELLIALLNQAFFFLVVWLVFCLARKLFDGGVAWLSAVVLMATELFWRISLSGLSTMLLLVIFLCLTWCLVWMEQGAEEFSSTFKLLGLAGLAGLLLGLGTLTRYSFAWMCVPVVAFIAIFLGNRRLILCLFVLIVFGAVTVPWLMRNYDLSGALFGTASYSVYEGSASFPATSLLRSLDPDFTHVAAFDLPAKLIISLRTMLTDDIPRLGGSWVSAFFLVGLLVPFKSPSLSRLRAFLLMALAMFIVVQALGSTPFHADTRATSSENLLVILAPLVFMYGVGLFFTVLDQARAAVWEARPLFVGAFIAIAVAPLVGVLLPPRTVQLAYPAYFSPQVLAGSSSLLSYPLYFPPVIQRTSRWLKPDEFMMSDVPWAVAWYGQRTCIWLPLNSNGDFDAIQRQRPVQALYLTSQTLDNRFLTQWVEGENQGWGSFITKCMLRREVPDGFPLTHAYTDLFPSQLFLTDRERWNEPAR